jgi:hypothetical protein
MASKIGTLMEETISLLRERTKAFPHIAQETGISFYWLRKFAYHEIDNPSVNTVQQLYEYLAERKLDVKVERTGPRYAE